MAPSPLVSATLLMTLLGLLLPGCMDDRPGSSEDITPGMETSVTGDEYEVPVATIFDSTVSSGAVNGTSTGVARGDYNGDGFSDLVVGEPDKAKVTVFFGSRAGVGNADCTAPEPRVFSGNPGSRFGAAVAIGPFIRGGSAPHDLAVGIPGEDRVRFIRGNAFVQDCDGSGAGEIELTSQNCTAQPNSDGTLSASCPEPSNNERTLVGPANSQFGAALAWGEFDDLTLKTTVAFRFVDTNNDRLAGADDPIYLHFGTTTTVKAGDIRLTSAGASAPGSRVGASDADNGQALGATPALTARFLDDNGDGSFTTGEAVLLNVDGGSAASAPDVRLTGSSFGSRVGSNGAEVGSPLVALQAQAKAATVDGIDVVYLDADSSGKISFGDLRLTQVLAKAPGTRIALGDPDLQALGDLVVGAPAADATYTPFFRGSNGACQRQAQTTVQDAGAVFVYRSGSKDILANREPITLAQNVPVESCPIAQSWTGLGDRAERNDQVGSVLSAFETRVFIGVPKENTSAGLVHVVDLGAGAAQVTNYRRAVESRSDGHGTPDAAIAGEGFGTSLAPGKFFFGGRAGLAVGAPGQAAGSCSANGGRVFLYDIPVARGPLTFRSTLGQSGHHYATGETSECLDQFGAALAAGDFQATGVQQLAVGSPGEDVSGRIDAGIVHVFPLTRTATASAPVQAKAVAAPADVVGFGHLVGAWNFGNDTSPVSGGFAKTVDLAVAGSKAGCPMVAVFFGSTGNAMFSRPTHLEGHLDGSECTPGQATRFGALY